MDIHDDKSPVSGALTQTDQVNSIVLWQCLHVIKTVPEFCSLTYRITKTHNDVEVLVVFREGVLGVFGPPVEPISLTLDPKGRCLLAVLFKPVERVSIVNHESGQIDVASLLAILRLVSGKGYVFCPGFPEKFVTGKACGKFVVLHKVPFKRYQSTHCLVYYQGQQNQQGRASSSLCALCPRCLQAAKYIFALPNFATSTCTAVAQGPAQFRDPAQVKSGPKNLICSNTSTSMTNPLRADKSADSPLPPASMNGFSPQTDCLSSVVASLTSEPQNRAHPSSKRHISELDVNGNTESAGSFTDSDRSSMDGSSHTSVDAKIQVLTQVLTNLMQDQCQGKPLDVLHGAPELKGMNKKSGKAKKLASYCLDKSLHRKRNVCHHCQKQYSSRARLLSHLQRHEALPGVWHYRFRQRKRRRKPSVLSVVHRMFRESKLPATMSKHRPAVLSEMSVRLFLQYLDDLISSQNGATPMEQQQCSSKKMYVEKKKIKSQLDSVVYVQEKNGDTLKTKCEQAENGSILRTKFEQVENGGTKGSLKRSTCDFSPMHTLLHAAAIAEVGQADKNHLFMASPLTPAKQEGAAGSSTSQAPSLCLHTSEDSVPQKKPRKSSRLAFKRARNNKTRAREDNCCTETVDMDNSAVSQEHCMLTNLNLLSTVVSLETAMRQAVAHSQSTGITHLQGEGATHSQSPPSTHSKSVAATHLHSPATTPSPSPAAECNTQNAAFTFSSVPLTVAFPAGRKRVNTASSSGQSQSTVGDFPAQHLPPTSVNILQNLLNITSGGNILISRSQEPSSRPSSNSSSQAKSALPPVPPLLFAGETQRKGLLVPLLTPRSHSPTVCPSTSLLRSLVTDKNKGLTFSETQSTENLLVNDNCGAIDLSKPKLYINTSLSLNKEKSADLSPHLGHPHNMAQLVASSSSSDSLHCFMQMANNSAGPVEQTESQSLLSIIGDKQTDSDLQARMFASARNYRLETGAAHAPHVQAVIASSSRAVQSGKAVKPGAPTDEIQCGYKWSGSGGLVKERTQMVRELVPPDVMASYLTKPRPGNKVPQPLNISMYKTSQPPAAGPQILPSSMAAWCKQTQDSSSASELAVNLIKLSENPSNSSVTGRIQKAAGGLTSVPALDWSPTSPGSILQNILRSSLANKSSVVESSSDSSGSTPKTQPKTVILSLTRTSTPTSLSSTPPPSRYTVSSPSLAAILRQPLASACENSKLIGSVDLVSTPVSVSYQHKLSTDTCPALSLSSGVLVKSEPPDLDSTEEVATITGLPVKAEQDSRVESPQHKESSSHAQSSLSNLMIDLSSETTVKCDTEKLRLTSAKTPHLATKNTSVRCKH